MALVTGLRGGVSESVEEAMRVSGLSHILSISGLHMALVATTTFFLARALLALWPALALRWPIKAYAAVPAIAAATFYLVLSGNEVPTQRSYLMTLLVLAGIMLGRPALTLRTLAIAALIVLAAAPATLLDPGTQMSFAATLALVAAHEAFGRRLINSVGATHAGRRPRAALCRGAAADLAGRRAGDRALRRLPFPAPRTVQPAGQSRRCAAGIADRHAVRAVRRAAAAVRLGRTGMVGHGLRH